MFLPKSKYKIKQAAWGQFYLSGSARGEYYVGPYIEDYRGRTFAGSDISKAQDRVLISTSEEVTPIEEYSSDYSPKEDAFVSGSYIRYFRQNTVTTVVEEITEEQLKQSGPFIYTSGSWIVTGSLDDILIYGIPYRGVRWRNTQTLNAWDKEISGIISALNLKPEDFVQDYQSS